jgi:hypothetical protein
MFKLKPDYEMTRQRIQAFWELELIDRPVVQFSGLLKPPEECLPLPPSHHTTSADRWMDAQYQAERALVSLSNQEFLGDTLPITFPNLGPEVFSCFYGCPLHFGDYGTSWTDPIMTDWSQAADLHLDWNSPYLNKLHEMTDALIELGKDTFITGMTDWHPGGDAIAAFRDPQLLAMDMIDHKDAVMTLLQQLEADYFKVYDIFYAKLRAAGLPCTSWTPLIHDGKYYIPSNDFSIMVSDRMFQEVFLPGIIRECQFLDRSIYHLDGPRALSHLDTLLSIPELDAIQYVWGTGNEGFHRWVWVYQRVQQARKGIQVICDVSELEQIIEALDPHGVFLTMDGVRDRDTAEAVLRRLERWAVDKG